MGFFNMRNTGASNAAMGLREDVQRLKNRVAAYKSRAAAYKVRQDEYNKKKERLSIRRPQNLERNRRPSWSNMTTLSKRGAGSV